MLELGHGLSKVGTEISISGAKDLCGLCYHFTIFRVWFRNKYHDYDVEMDKATTTTTTKPTPEPIPEPILVKEKILDYNQMTKDEKRLVSDTLITFLKDPNIEENDKWFIVKRFLRGIKKGEQIKIQVTSSDRGLKLVRM